jgi:hypothetical protein
MKIPEKMREVLKHEGVAAIATNGLEGADYDALKATYPWLRACIAITIDQVTQTN